MATASDAGITDGINYVKAQDLVDEVRVFSIVGASFRAAHFTPDGQSIKDQVEFEIKFLDVPDDDQIYIVGLGDNAIRRRYITWFEQHPDEPINGIAKDSPERGVVMYEGERRGGFNPPKLFRDVTDAELAKNDIPF